MSSLDPVRLEDAANMFAMFPDQHGLGDWLRDAPWTIKRGNFETTYSRTRSDGKAQTAHIRIHRHDFLKSAFAAGKQLAASLYLADEGDRRKEAPRPSWRKRGRR